MTRAKPTPLGPSLIAKGTAHPAIEPTPVVQEPAPPLAANLESAAAPVEALAYEAQPPRIAPTPTVAVKAKESIVSSGTSKSMTVKIDNATYKKLKLHGVNTERSSQDIFLIALTRYLKSEGL